MVGSSPFHKPEGFLLSQFSHLSTPALLVFSALLSDDAYIGTCHHIVNLRVDYLESSQESEQTRSHCYCLIGYCRGHQVDGSTCAMVTNTDTINRFVDSIHCSRTLQGWFVHRQAFKVRY